MRKNIFEIASEKMDLPSEVSRLLQMSRIEKVLVEHGILGVTLFEYVDEHCFTEWKYRGHYTDVKDFLQTVEFDLLAKEANKNPDSLLTLIELIYNFWNLANRQLRTDNSNVGWTGNFYHLQNVMNDILAQYNQAAYCIDDEKILVAEDKEEVTAVAEIVEEETAAEIIRYNHRTLQGNIDEKKAILLKLGAELEAKRKTLQSMNSQLADNIFFMLNNMNLRHNNKEKGNAKNYKEYVAKMRKDSLEKWYDELYQMILLAFLLIEDSKRAVRIKGLKEKINGGQVNG